MTAAPPHKELGCWIGTIRGSKQKQLEEEFTVNQLVTGRDTFKEQSISEVKMDRVHQSAENCRFRIMFLTVNMSSRTVMMELIHSSACHPHMQDKERRSQMWGGVASVPVDGLSRYAAGTSGKAPSVCESTYRF